jgi:hypothetical protein
MSSSVRTDAVPYSCKPTARASVPTFGTSAPSGASAPAGTIDESFTSAVNSVSTCSCVTPDFMRPNRKRNAFLPESPGQRSSRKMSASGSAPMRTTGLKLKSGGSTPPTVRGTPSMLMDCPMIAGSALSDVRHSRSLTMALRSSSGAAAPVRNARPRAGLTPSVAKKFGLTSSARTCTGSPRPVSCASIEVYAAR